MMDVYEWNLSQQNMQNIPTQMEETNLLIICKLVWIPTPGPPTISATATETAWRTVGRKLSIQTIESEFVKAVLLKYLPPPGPPPLPPGQVQTASSGTPNDCYH